MATLAKVYLVDPKSPKQAWYSLKITKNPDCFCVEKQSGPKGVLTDSRYWKCETLQIAVRLFTNKLREKTKPHNGRNYTLMPVQTTERYLVLPIQM